MLHLEVIILGYKQTKFFPEQRILVAHLAMLLFSVLVSLSFVIGAKVANSIDPLAITFARFCIAMVLIGAVYRMTVKISFLDFQSPWRFLILGFLISTYFVLMFEGLKTAEPVSMSVVFTLTPLLAGFFDYLVVGRKMSKSVTIAVILGAFGAVWIIFEGNLNRIMDFDVGYGELIFFVGCAGHAMYASLIPRLNKGETPLAQTLGTLIACSLILLLVGSQSISTNEWKDLSLFVWASIFYLAIFATASSFFLIQFATRRLSSVKVMAYTYAIPFWVAYFNWLFGGGMPEIKLLWGALLIVCVLFFLLSNRDY